MKIWKFTLSGTKRLNEDEKFYLIFSINFSLLSQLFSKNSLILYFSTASNNLKANQRIWNEKKKKKFPFFVYPLGKFFLLLAQVYSRVAFFRVAFFRVTFFPSDIFLVAFFWVAFSGGFFLGSFFPGGILPSGIFPGWHFPGWHFLGGIFPGWHFSSGFFLGGFFPRSRKNGLIRKMRFISKFVTSQPG